MKESRFIELLNLYVDHQLSAVEAAELETEIARNSGRRSTYQQYCRMQKACTVLFEQERAHAPASRKLAASLKAADRKIVEFPYSRPHRAYFPVGLLAAAACVAFVFARFHPLTPGSKTAPQSDLQANVITHAAPAAVEAVQPVTIPASYTPSQESATPRASFYSVFATRNSGRTNGASSNQFNDEDSNATTAVSYSWMRDVQLAPVQPLSTTTLSLKSSSLVSSEERVLQSRKPVKSNSDPTAAWQFQR